MIHIDIPKDVGYILSSLKKAGYEAYAVGGCVRDCLLGKEPKDWDITTSALPEQVKEIFQKTVDTGIKHGTVTVMIHGTGYEVTTYRVDGDYLDGRHPENVSFTSCLDEDLKRRDFTINAFVYSEETGIKDLFGGMEDLKDGVIRCVGVPEERFGEDALRILRAVRFAAVLGFGIEPETYKAAYKLRSTMQKVSSERIKAELDKTLMSDNPGHIFLLKKLKLDEVILPEFVSYPEAFENRIGNVLKNSPKELSVRWALFFYMIKDDNREETASQVMRRLKFDNKNRDRILLFLRNSSMKLPQKVDRDFRTGVRKLINCLGNENIWDYISFCNALAFEYEWFSNDYDALKNETEDIFRNNECTSLRELNVNGFDIKALGDVSGTTIGETLNKLLEKVLKQPELNTKDRLLEIAEQILKENYGNGWL